MPMVAASTVAGGGQHPSKNVDEQMTAPGRNMFLPTRRSLAVKHLPRFFLFMVVLMGPSISFVLG